MVPVVSAETAAPVRALADVFLDLIASLGVETARGVTGGPISRLVTSLEDHPTLKWVTCRSEGGAVFQAIGAWNVTRRPALVVTTSGPGMLGVRQAMEVAKHEGVQLVMVSPRTPASQRRRGMPQGSEQHVSADFLLAGLLFDVVAVLESPDELASLASDLSAGFSGRGGFLAHVVVPSDLLTLPASPPIYPKRRRAILAPDPTAVDEVVDLLRDERFFMVVGDGARENADLVRRLANVTGAPVLLTPAGKGVLDERGASVFGVTGIGGHPEALTRLRAYQPTRALVLGTTLSGASVSDEVIALAPSGLVHVDRDPFAMGPAWQVPTLAIEADLGAFLEALLARASEMRCRPLPACINPVPVRRPSSPPTTSLVRPQMLMHTVQKRVLDATDAPIFVEVGSVWPWATSCLAVSHPRRWSLETGVGCMGRAFASAVGAALASGRKTVALVGDWSTDMAWPELRTAVDHDALVVWIVANTEGGQMVIDGDASLWGRSAPSARFRPGDLAAAARALGAGGSRVTSEEQLEEALSVAMASTTPYLVDVHVDTTEAPPYGPRFSLLRSEAAGR